MSEESMVSGVQLKLSAEDEERRSQFRLRRVQSYNWGTFRGLQDIPVAERGYLFVGPSGSGKSTLLDANSILLVPPRQRRLNTAADDRGKKRSDRNRIGYIRGAWSKGEDAQGQTVVRYLRKDTTWSAIAQTYRNSDDVTVTLVCLYWVIGRTNAENAVNQAYMVFRREFNVREFETLRSDEFDRRVLRKRFSDAFLDHEFPGYQEHFRRLLGIDSEKALLLLHQTQTSKSVGNLSRFLRDFMLDEPQTFALAAALVNQFQDLKEAHRSMVDARRQIEVLKPAREAYERLLEAREEEANLREDLKQLDGFSLAQTKELLQAALEQGEEKLVEQQGLVDIRKAEEDAAGEAYESMRRRLQDQGGAELDSIAASIALLEDQRESRQRQFGRMQAVYQALGWEMPASSASFTADIKRAKALDQSLESLKGAANASRDELVATRRSLEEALRRITEEHRALQEKGSNISGPLLRIRSDIAAELGLSEDELPFAGELIDVRESEKHWHHAIERVLGGFGRTLVVPEDHYLGVARYVDSHDLRGRLEYQRVAPRAASSPSASRQSLIHKLELVAGPWRGWLLDTLNTRFDYACVQTADEMGQHDKAVTLAGQVKLGRSRYVKDDRPGRHEPLNWVLGSNNAAKLALLEKEARRLADERTEVFEQIEAAEKEKTHQEERQSHCRTLAMFEWDNFDVAATARAIDEFQARRARILQAPGMAEAERQVFALKEEHARRRRAFEEVQLACRQLEKQLNDWDDALTGASDRLLELAFSPQANDRLAERFARHGETPTLKTVEALMSKLRAQLNQALFDCQELKNQSERAMALAFKEYVDTWGSESGDLQPNELYAADFMDRLTELETKGLQDYENRFNTMAQELNHQSVTQLATRLSNERKEIQDRLEEVNESLRLTPYNRELGTHLKIILASKHLDDVSAFMDELKGIQADLVQRGADLALNEARFARLDILTRRLSGQTVEDRNWRDRVLDVRDHVELKVHEVRLSDGKVENVYDSGAGKSGGQRLKLAATCLAAALRYQLSGLDRTVPQFATVVMDEAFDKTDANFTRTTLDTFAAFGFQMVVATPMKSVKTLSPYIGGACLVSNNEEGNDSGVQVISYDEVNKRLQFEELVQELEQVDENA